MAHDRNDAEDEKPLDPALDIVRRKMLRLQIISAVIMIVSLFAVFGAIIYKISSRADDTAPAGHALAVPSGAPLEFVAPLPDGFKVEQVSYGDGSVTFFGTRADGRQAVYIFDLTTGRMAATVSIP
ncbi:hypothetical protein FJU08_09535 [Martelella alba]|uniref:Transmembrane protein n=1 Tax=Martelella alba TaxID=2590451 RepID=A0A506UAH5_9HYPH|nr:hypothetical protein [Martelella alba]TPW30900.1 hypothetical protein FJU08_09535 [Martelella alba]